MPYQKGHAAKKEAAVKVAEAVNTVWQTSQESQAGMAALGVAAAQDPT